MLDLIKRLLFAAFMGAVMGLIVGVVVAFMIGLETAPLTAPAGPVAAAMVGTLMLFVIIGGMAAGAIIAVLGTLLILRFPEIRAEGCERARDALRVAEGSLANARARLEVQRETVRASNRRAELAIAAETAAIAAVIALGIMGPILDPVLYAALVGAAVIAGIAAVAMVANQLVAITELGRLESEVNALEEGVRVARDLVAQQCPS